ncbi:MAG: efflux RND transporter periplasmic adaptor subunit [Candidatus Sedimenticola endophacoides]|uniref:Efflux RND transporter periplasmic adaptor subunit n=2 Tax=Candidatus Sedimenticola endophacoides TaxID=2548426 RepID=A0A6N4DW86_9GAMM|nr:MAG: efflux RND transporter periplasmic adaptor subunit [Candidatus Sedimenticola endophacoides]PUE02209.1 MAG: efflux RND transporter periplasmic adaptor subunit [Candidatus Sedimenticola endophacoides]PUE05139.1 MAG: efflux RND transporter periplasmic adaptor subunit [Candidatus Sedimenticola endophacoides]
MGKQLQALVLVAGGALAAVTATQGLAQDTPGAQYHTVQQVSDVPKVALGGTVIPYKEVTLSAQVPGRVEFLAGIEGDAFDEGEMLVALDDSELLAKRNAALAQLATADAQMRAAGVQYNRELWSPQSKQSMGGMGMPNLFDQMFSRPMENFVGSRDTGVERRADLYSSGVQITQAQNAILAAQSQIQAVDAKLRDARSMAPFNGVVMRKFVEVGDTMQPGQPLLVFADVEYLQIAVDVPSRLRPGLSEGMMLQAELDVGNQIIPVRVAQIFPMADAQRHTVKVKFDLPQGVSAPGMYAKVLVPDFTSSAKSYPVIPGSAVRYNGSLPGVYVLGAEGRHELRLIRVGEKQNGMISVLSGLVAGERVLTNPSVALSSAWAAPSGAER